MCVWQSRQGMFMCGEIVNCCLKWLNSSYGCLLWLFLVWWFIELTGCDVDVLASFPLILFSLSYRPHWGFGPTLRLRKGGALYRRPRQVRVTCSTWRYCEVCSFLSDVLDWSKIFDASKVFPAISLCLKPIGMTSLKPKVKKHRVAGLNPT